MKTISGTSPVNPNKQARIAHYDRRNPADTQDHGTKGTFRGRDYYGLPPTEMKARQSLQIEPDAYTPWHPDQMITSKPRRRALAARELTRAANSILRSAGFQDLADPLDSDNEGDVYTEMYGSSHSTETQGYDNPQHSGLLDDYVPHMETELATSGTYLGFTREEIEYIKSRHIFGSKEQSSLAGGYIPGVEWAEEITAQRRYTPPVDPYEGLSPEDRIDLQDGFHIINPNR